MKKLLVLFMVLAFVAPVVPVMADDTLDLSGTLRVRAWSKENSNWGDADTADQQFWDQRMRIEGVIAPADGVKGVFRIDFAEDTWGSTNWEGSRYGSGTELQVDRAYLDVTKGMFNVKAGQQYMGLGNNFAYDDNALGLQFTLKTPVVVRFGYNKRTENSTSTTTYSVDPGPDGILGTGDDITVPTTTVTTDSHDETNGEDQDRYFLDVGYKSDAFSVNAFYAMQTDGDDATQDEPTLMGVMAKFAVGPANIMAEINSFGGSVGDTVDYVGMQFIGDVSMKFSDAFTAGVNLVYSSGEDEADEEKITKMPGAFGSCAYSDLGPFNTDIMAFGGDDVFDPASTNSGAMGAGVYVKFMPLDVLSIHGQFVYLTGVEDGTNDGDKMDSGMVAGVGIDYQLVQNANIAAEYLMADYDTVNDADVEAKNVMVARIQIAF